MDLLKLIWDSNFFKKEIYSCTLTDIDSFFMLKEKLNFYKADLCYIFVNPTSYELIEYLEFLGISCYDKKITYVFDDFRKLSYKNTYIIDSFYGNSTNELFELSYLAGFDSRFKKDPKLSSKFKELYKIWLESSLDRTIADEFFVYKNDINKLLGFVTCSKYNRIGKIGLIATDKNTQGLGIGNALLNEVHKWYFNNNVDCAEVVTQGSNKVACNFYENNGYKLHKEVLVFHWWV